MVHSITVSVAMSTQELQQDLERIARGELSLPTVSAITACIDGKEIRTIPIFLEAE
jgi:hypothetical protein